MKEKNNDKKMIKKKKNIGLEWVLGRSKYCQETKKTFRKKDNNNNHIKHGRC